MVLMSQIGTRVWIYNNWEDHWYIFPSDKASEFSKEVTVVQALMSFYLLFNQLIPLDVAVNLVLTKLFYTLFMEADSTFVDLQRSIDRGGKLVGCSVRNMTMLEDVANITHVFCDKTGTLTQNQLVFRALAFGEECFRIGDADDAISNYSRQVNNYWDKGLKDDASKVKFVDFWRCICVCHDAIQFIDKGAQAGKVKYSGASMDEVTFLEMCRDSGFISFKHRDSDVITINVQGKEERYKILRVIEFTSDRKRMSVAVKNMENGKIINFVKGADLAILQRINQNQPFEQQCIEKMDDLATEGLRTLMFAIREFPDGTDE